MGLFDPRRNADSGQKPGSGIGARLLIALVIAGIAWFTYMSQVEVNPVTGKKQHVAISPDQEIRLGLESAPQMSREMGGELSANDPRTQEVQRVGEYVIDNSMAKNSPWKFNFHLLADDQTVNAFALPGGQIFITLGLLDKLQTEAQLAGVLSHEIGHVIERHTAEQMAKNQLGQMLVMAVGSAANQGQSTPYNPAVIASLVNQVIQLRYSRADESEADTWGLKLMEQAGFDPRAMVQVMEVLKKASGGRESNLEIFQTHPNPDLRIEQINAYLKENPPVAGLSQGKNLKEVYGDYRPGKAQQEPGNILDWLFQQQ
jgi:predicted Zn-dependent protease